ncbi:hypothetical protein [Roseateles sp.]|uniref:hypothetical protein n=1 Tax=Roseateles sp. TaxID=1971397 RepID=UPI003267DE6C
MRIIIFLTFVLYALAAHAQPALPDGSADPLLACLLNPRSPPELPREMRARLRDQPRSSRLVRVKLVFESAVAAPRVEMLANTADEPMQDQVFDYLKGYRMPCLPLDGAPLAVVQEFVFAGDAPVRISAAQTWSEQAVSKKCVVMPRKAPEFVYSQMEDPIVKTLALVRFDGDGQQPPKVQILYSNAGPRPKKAILEYLEEYRMPCRQAGDSPYAFDQLFVYVFTSAKPPKFREAEVPLSKFMGWVKGHNALHASFDFDSMACPFKVTWTQRRPHLPNTAAEVGRRDPNRLEFLRWLAGLEIELDQRSQDWLFDESMVIDIPCGQFAAGPGG